jgi:hypothetical protein
VFTNKDARWAMVCFPTKMTAGNCTLIFRDAFQLPTTYLHRHRDCHLFQQPYTKFGPRSSTWNGGFKHALNSTSPDSDPCAGLGTSVTSCAWDTVAAIVCYTCGICIPANRLSTYGMHLPPAGCPARTLGLRQATSRAHIRLGHELYSSSLETDDHTA